MTNIELTQITQLLHKDPNKFYTDLSAYNKGFVTPNNHIFSQYKLYNREILQYITTQTPHLLEHYVRYEGKLTTKHHNIDVYYNLHLYSDAVINEDITYDRIHLYGQVMDKLSEDNRKKIYSHLDLKSYTIILNNDITVPIQHLKEEYLVLYINYMSDRPNFEQFLIELNRADFIIEHYKLVANETIDKYIMKNVTIINENVINSLLTIGMKATSIVQYNPKTLHYIVPYINTIDELRIMIRAINGETRVETIELIIEKFPYVKGIIESRIDQIIKG